LLKDCWNNSEKRPIAAMGKMIARTQKISPLCRLIQAL